MTHSRAGPEWDFKQYKFAAKVNSDVQNVSAVRKGEGIAMTAEVRGLSIPKEAAWKPNTVVLDNFIAAHYQVLLNAIVRQTGSDRVAGCSSTKAQRGRWKDRFKSREWQRHSEMAKPSR